MNSIVEDKNSNSLVGSVFEISKKFSSGSRFGRKTALIYTFLKYLKRTLEKLLLRLPEYFQLTQDNSFKTIKGSPVYIIPPTY